MGITDWLLELLFPSRCAFCGRLTGPGQEVCGDCAGALPRVPDGQVLRRAGDYGCAVAFYYDGPVREGVLGLKFHNKPWRARVFGGYIAQTAAEHLSGRFDAVTYVPVSWQRRYRRGYDQARLLALVWFLFQRECFFSTVILSGALFTVWLCGNVVSIRTAVIVGAVAVLLGLAAAAWVVHLLQKGQGKLAGVQIMDTMCEYWLLYSVLGLSFVSIAVALLAVPAAYYLMWVLGVALFAEMVYYTTQLM